MSSKPEDNIYVADIYDKTVPPSIDGHGGEGAVAMVIFMHCTVGRDNQWLLF